MLLGVFIILLRVEGRNISHQGFPHGSSLPTTMTARKTPSTYRGRTLRLLLPRKLLLGEHSWPSLNVNALRQTQVSPTAAVSDFSPPLAQRPDSVQPCVRSAQPLALGVESSGVDKGRAIFESGRRRRFPRKFRGKRFDLFCRRAASTHSLREVRRDAGAPVEHVVLVWDV